MASSNQACLVSSVSFVIEDKVTMDAFVALGSNASLAIILEGFVIQDLLKFKILCILPFRKPKFSV